jgi:hypothetical protein
MQSLFGLFGSSSTSTMVVNGRRLTLPKRNFRSLSVCNGKVVIDGVPWTGEDSPADKDLEIASKICIEVQGPVERIESSAANVVVHSGDVGSIATQSGDVHVHGDVKKSVSTMSGDVRVDGHLTGSASSMSGDITCKSRAPVPLKAIDDSRNIETTGKRKHQPKTSSSSGADDDAVENGEEEKRARKKVRVAK